MSATGRNIVDARVLCICPFHVPQFIELARKSFRHQTYENKRWMEWDTSTQKLTVGAIRNRMIEKATPDFTGGYCNIVAHFDHDDWSCPTRLAEQVAFMQSSGASVVGYRDMPFYDVQRDQVLFYDSHRPSGYVLGTSLMYKREVWEKTPFPDATPEDTNWQRQVGEKNIASQSSIGPIRMIQTIHGKNASAKTGARFRPASKELDAEVRRILDAVPVPNMRVRV